MQNKTFLAIVLLICCVFQSVVSTRFVLDALSKALEVKCKLRNDFVHPSHRSQLGDKLCSQQEVNNENSILYGQKVNQGNGYGNSGNQFVNQGNGFGNRGNHYGNGFGNHQNQFGNQGNGYGNQGNRGNGHGNQGNGYGNQGHNFGNLGNGFGNQVPQPECTRNVQCSIDQLCYESQCINPCPNFCGTDAKCEVIDHVPQCRCYEGYIGNANIRCYQEEKPDDSQKPISQVTSTEKSANFDNGENKDNLLVENIKDVFGNIDNNPTKIHLEGTTIKYDDVTYNPAKPDIDIRIGSNR